MWDVIYVGENDPKHPGLAAGWYVVDEGGHIQGGPFLSEAEAFAWRDDNQPPAPSI